MKCEIFSVLYNFGIIYPSNSLRSELLRVFIFNPPPFCLVPGLSISGRFTINSPGTGRVHPPLAVGHGLRQKTLVQLVMACGEKELEWVSGSYIKLTATRLIFFFGGKRGRQLLKVIRAISSFLMRYLLP